MRACRARNRGTVERHSDAVVLLQKPGDYALVLRDVPRLLVIACPDGCGDIVPVNLDGRVAKAWRHYLRNSRTSLYPSVWRDEGCQAHFVLWNDIIYWTATYDGHKSETDLDAVFGRLSTEKFQSPLQIALDMDEVPWAVAQSCRILVRLGKALEGRGKLADHYRRL